ncbi:CD48 antigen-like [Xenopus tropicalis]|uniref:CD48 antigen-like n=1 Tax=Xenopus tropicalis TaxID=8364 RepID=A0A8J1IQ93_XENTR|nr:CD48 antigen-like [Xenopus tropicalis]
MFHVNGIKKILAEFRDQKFIRVNENYFPNRLEGSNSGTALLIRELRMEDSGMFTALIFVNGKMRDISYNLTVFEPIPTPVIEKTLDGNSTDLCHLHCSVPSNSPTLSYSWTYRDTGTDRLYANGSTITVSLKDKALGAEFTCWVQNPAHSNSTSVPLYPCGEAQTEAQRKDGICWIKVYIYLPVIAVLVTVVATVIFVTRQKHTINQRAR